MQAKRAVTITEGKLVAIVIGVVVAFFAVLVWPFWNLMPEYVTEEVTVIYKDNFGCVVETSDGIPFTIGPCEQQVGDTIELTYDVKIKERLRGSIRNL